MSQPHNLTTTYLQQLCSQHLIRARIPALLCTFVKAEIPSPALSRYLYTAVGGDWHWHDRLPWSWQQWLTYLSSAKVHTWVLYVQGTPAGYIELQQSEDGSEVEVVYFGLIRGFVGQGLGGHLLSLGLEAAWQLQPRRVWVHTCTLDGPFALANYQARGMQIFDQHTEVRRIGASAGPWPQADTTSSS